MKVYEYFQILRSNFPEIKDNEEVKVNLLELSKIIHSSPRNTKLLLIRMIDKEWISFKSGRGRGNLSTLVFKVDIQQIFKEQVENFLTKRDFSNALAFLQKNWNYITTKDEIFKTIYSHFGLQETTIGSKVVETLRVPIHRKLITLNPSEAFYSFDTHLIRQIYNTLVIFDEQTNKLMPSLAHYWEFNKTHTEWTFYIRKKIHFHNGAELTAEDVFYSFHTLTKYKSSWIMNRIQSIEVISRYCIKFFLFESNQMFPLFLSYPQASIIALGSNPDNQPVGTGPYKVMHFSADNCYLQAFNNYFEHPPQVDHVEIYNLASLHYVEKNDSFKRFDIFNETVESNKVKLDNFIEKHEISGPTVLTLNHHKQSVINDHLFKKAIKKLVNTENLIHNLGGWRSSPSNGFINKEKPIANIEIGIQLLYQSRYEGETLQLYTFPRHRKDAYWLTKELKKYGIKVNVNIIDWAQMLLSKKVHEADMILFEAETSKGVLRLLEYYLSDYSFIQKHLSKDNTNYIETILNKTMQKSSSIDVLIESLSSIDDYIAENTAIIFLANVLFKSYFHPSLAVKANERGWIDYKYYWVK
ncbi:ABC transporter substrate-binding protein [Niallia circulans]|uniref:ABC transporter substrate-binding protein n=1 Tax=Niallia circulans TaxID=1397 RepID=UPI00397DB9C0